MAKGRASRIYCRTIGKWSEENCKRLPIKSLPTHLISLFLNLNLKIAQIKIPRDRSNTLDSIVCTHLTDNRNSLLSLSPRGRMLINKRSEDASSEKGEDHAQDMRRKESIPFYSTLLMSLPISLPLGPR